MGGQLHRGRRHSSRRAKQKVVCNKPFTATLCVYFFVCGVFLFLFQLSIPQCLSDTKCLSNFSMHHIFPKNASVVRGKEHQIKSTAKSRTFSILSPQNMPQCFISGFWEYHSITDQHESSHSTHFHQTTVSHENMGLSWISSLYGWEQAALQKVQIQSHWQLHAISCPVHFVTANISCQQQRMLCHVIILCHYVGFSQILHLKSRHVV